MVEDSRGGRSCGEEVLEGNLTLFFDVSCMIDFCGLCVGSVYVVGASQC